MALNTGPNVLISTVSYSYSALYFYPYFQFWYAASGDVDFEFKQNNVTLMS